MYKIANEYVAIVETITEHILSLAILVRLNKDRDIFSSHDI